MSRRRSTWTTASARLWRRDCAPKAGRSNGTATTSNETKCSTEIYEYIGERGWHLLTKDKGLRKKPIEIDRMLECGVRVFSLAGTDMNAEQMAECFIRNRLAIGRLLKNHDQAFVAYVLKDSATIPQVVFDRMEAARKRLSGKDE